MSGKTLIVVDVQSGFVNGHTRHVVPAVERLQTGCDRIYVTRFVNPPASPWRRFMDWRRFAEGPADAELGIRPAAHAVIARKDVYSCVNEDLLHDLRDRETAEVFLCGIDTDACVLVSAVDLFQNGIRPVILAEACASHAGPEYHEAGLRLLERLIGKDQIIR